MRCSTFHSIAPCSFESILMPESSLEECMLMLICWNCYNLLIYHFCHDWCVHPMGLMSSSVLIYAMPSFQGCHPCIFVICVLSASSLLIGVLVVVVFLTASVIFCCYVNMLLQVISCIIWRCSINMFWCTCHPLSIHALGCNYSLLEHVVILLQSCLKMLLSAC